MNADMEMTNSGCNSAGTVTNTVVGNNSTYIVIDLLGCRRVYC